MLAQGRLDECEVLDQLAGAQVVAAGDVRGVLGQSPAGVEQLLPDAGDLEPVGLLGVEPLVAGADLGQDVEIALEGVQQLLRGAAVADGVGQGGTQLVDVRQGVVDAVLVLEQQHLPGHGGGDVGVAVAVAADPGAEGERAGGGRQRRSGALQFGGEVLQDVSDGAAVQLVEVVDGVARLVGGLGTDDAQLVGLPDEVDVLGESQVGAAPLVGVGVLQQLGDPAELGEHGPAGGLGGVCGEDGSYAQVADGLPQVVGVGLLEHVRGAGEVAALGGPAGAQFASAVDLFGDVGQVEVGGEGPDELGRRREVGPPQQGRGCLAVGPGQGADALDEFQQFGALLADQRLAEEVAQAADVGPQGTARSGCGFGVAGFRPALRGTRKARCGDPPAGDGIRTTGARGGVGTAHRCGSLQCVEHVLEVADRAVRRVKDRAAGQTAGDTPVRGLLPRGPPLPYLRHRRLRNRRRPMPSS